MSDRGIQLIIPTYDPETQECDASKPHALTLREETGLRIVLGDPGDPDAPDLLIERYLDRWYIVVHPNEGDPLCIIEITGDSATVKSDTGAPAALLVVPVGAREGCGKGKSCGP